MSPLPAATAAPVSVGAEAVAPRTPPTGSYPREQWWEIEVEAAEKGWKSAISPEGLRAQHTDGTVRTFPTPDAARAVFKSNSTWGRFTKANR
jgi:hypothetical protein